MDTKNEKEEELNVEKIMKLEKFWLTAVLDLHGWMDGWTLIKINKSWCLWCQNKILNKLSICSSE
jgi:hypothetical protein